jgi:benzylsuccinate CoA-transferase BbsF subunit
MTIARRPAAGASAAVPVSGRLPLAGIRVLDLTWVIGGPFCTCILAALGADVVRLETAARPEFADRGGFFPVMGAGKRSCTINLTHPRGRKLAQRLVVVSDALVENFSAGVLERMGLGWDEVHARNPGLVMLSASGLGRQGPRAAYLAYGSLLQAYTGWAGLIGFGSQEHVGLGGAWVDVVTGYTAAVALLAALRHRDRRGEGQRIDLSMAEAAIALMPEALLQAALTGRLPQPECNRARDAAPHGLYRCGVLAVARSTPAEPADSAGYPGPWDVAVSHAERRSDDPDKPSRRAPGARDPGVCATTTDSWLAIAAYDDAMWRALVRAMGSPEWASDPRFADLHGRKKHEDELDARIAAWTAGWQRDELVGYLRRAGVAAAPVRAFPEVLSDHHLAERGIAGRRSGASGEVVFIHLPWQDAAGLRGLGGVPPALGEHTSAVLGDLLGLSAAEIEELVAAGVAV